MKALSWSVVAAVLWSGAVFAGSKKQACQAECAADMKECVQICLNPEKPKKGEKEHEDKHAGSHDKVKVTPAVCKKLCADMAKDCQKECE